uniref:Peptidase A1 domain-containing protein n=1 Tax=Leersia perrieri TaxID=77586 RepID=A0A0D9WZT0_9ORYZ
MGNGGAPILSAFLLIVLQALAISATTLPDGFRGSLIHKKVTVDGGAHPLHSGRWLADVTGSTLKSTAAYYVMKLAVGTPAVTVQALIGGSDLCWVECAPCSGCTSKRLYSRANSTSFSPLPCSSKPCKALREPVRTTCTDTQCGYRYVYGGDGGNGTYSNYVQGTLGTETLRFGGSSEVAVKGFAFGCTDKIYRDDIFDGHFISNRNTGVIGLGRSNLSMVGQLGLDRFSYCLSSITKVASPILFGSKATFTGNAAVLSTPLLYDYVDYYVNLLGISVDGKRLTIPNGTFVLDTKTGRGGVSFDTSSPYTLLVDPAYTLVVEALKKGMSPAYKAVANNGTQLCYRVSEKSGNLTVPAMTLHFEGMDLDLSPRNVFAFDVQQSDLLCSVIDKSTTDSVIGNFMQMDFHVLFDLKKSVLGSLIRKTATLNGDSPIHAGERSRRRLSEPTGTHIKPFMGTISMYYVMEIAVGTPAVKVQAGVGSGDLCWVECSPCSGCNAPPRARPLYDRANSSSFSPLSCASQFCKNLQKQSHTTCTDAECGYRYAYEGNDTDHNNYVEGTLGTETFRFGGSDEVAVPGFANTGSIGIGRSHLSLVGQLGLVRFSYCLSSNLQASSPILFGSKAAMTGNGAISSTPIVSNYIDYNVNLLGISVGGTRLPIPNDTFVLDPNNGQGGVAFEIGATPTLLVDPAYTLVVEAFTARMSTAYKVVNGSSLPCFLVDGSASKNVTAPCQR